jgi:hypothetical protein
MTIEKLKELAQKATQGKWFVEYGVSLRSAWAIWGIVNGVRRDLIRLSSKENIDLDQVNNDVEQNLEFIEAANPQKILSLISRLEDAESAMLGNCQCESIRDLCKFCEYFKKWSVE